MFAFGQFRAADCHRLTRRAFVAAGASLPWLSPALDAGLALTSVVPGSNPSTAAAAERTGRAKSVIFVWLWGAPSHLDTFDPKPDAPDQYRGPFATIATRSPGVRFTELVPRLAARSHLFSVVRSHVTHDGGHPQAGTLGLTGYAETPGPVQPSFGSIIGRHRGPGALPPYVMLGRGVPRDVVKPVAGYGGGDWGRAHDPFLVNCDDWGDVSIPSLQMLDGLTPERLGDRRALAGQLDQFQRRVADSQFDQWNRSLQQAYTLLTSRSAVAALDLSHEPETRRNAYGQTAFGQSLLLARRLVEAEVPFVHVNWSEYVEALTPNTDFGWDTHIHNFDLLPTRHCPIFDRAFAALLDDLHDRGLLDSTLVVCMGEFGRTPRINQRAARDHWPQCYFSLWAGGGVKPSRVIGASDPKGEHPVTRPIHPPAVGATLCDLMGVNSVVRAQLNILPNASPIDELT
ncbi:MAG: DUF1501 domain-containing protein [Pirellulales bacterium]